MSTVKNGQVSPYCHFNKIIKGPGTSFQSSALNQKHFRKVCHLARYYLTKTHFDCTEGFKYKRNFHYAATPMMISVFEIYGFHRNTKI